MSYASYLDTRCAYVTANARRCSASRTSEHIPLCLYHQRQYLDQQGAHGGAMELLLPIEKFDSAADINRALGQVFKALARNAIPSRTAATLAYICQLLLNTLPALERKNLEAKAVPALKKILIHVLKHPIAEAATQCGSPPPKSYWEDPIRFEAGKLPLPGEGSGP